MNTDTVRWSGVVHLRRAEPGRLTVLCGRVIPDGAVSDPEGWARNGCAVCRRAATAEAAKNRRTAEDVIDELGGNLCEDEWEELARYAVREAWVWDQMAAHEADPEKRERNQRIADWERQRARLFSEAAALESDAQDEYERLRA